MKASWIMTVGLIVLALLVPVGLNLIYSEVEDVPQGGLEYWLGVPDPIKRVPIVSGCEAPRYTSRNARGDSPPFSAVHFASERSAAHLAEVLRSHFAAEGCGSGATVLSPDGLVCADGSEVTITIEAPEPSDEENTSDSAEDCIDVSVSIFNVVQR